MELQYLHLSLAGLRELAAQCNPCVGKDLVWTVPLAGLSASCPSLVSQQQLFQWAWVTNTFAIKTNRGIWFEPSTKHVAF